jgi:hypothetical protein
MTLKNQMNEKIEIVRYLEDNTVGATATAGLERMTERQLDLLIRLCRVNPDDEASMQRVKRAMAGRDAYRAERMQMDRQNESDELNRKYNNLPPDMKRQFIEYVRENRDEFGDIDMNWLVDPSQNPPIEFWTGENGIVMNEIVNRILFGMEEKENRELIDSALRAIFIYRNTRRESICSDLLIETLDSDIKHMIFWKYAKARLLYE